MKWSVKYANRCMRILLTREFKLFAVWALHIKEINIEYERITLKEAQVFLLFCISLSLNIFCFRWQVEQQRLGHWQNLSHWDPVNPGQLSTWMELSGMRQKEVETSQLLLECLNKLLDPSLTFSMNCLRKYLKLHKNI